MLRVILEISEWSLDKINLVYKDMIPTLEHNHNHFTSTLPMLYSIEMEKVKQQIKEVIKNI